MPRRAGHFCYMMSLLAFLQYTFTCQRMALVFSFRQPAGNRVTDFSQTIALY
jgi:hypothetical protein